jgi:hypothetical protein
MQDQSRHRKVRETSLGFPIEASRTSWVFSQSVLPPFLQHVEIADVRIGDAVVDLSLERHDKDVGINVLRREGKVGIVVMK